MASDARQKLLKSPAEQDRKKAIAMMIRQPDRGVLITLQEMAEVDENVEVRFYARKALAVVKAALHPRVTDAGPAPVPEALDPDRALAMSDDEKCALLQGIIDRNRVDLLPVLRDILSREHQPRALAALVIAIGKLGSVEDSKALIALLKHADARVRANVIEALELVGNLKVFAHILPLLEDPDNRVRANAAKSLRSIEPATSFRLLQAMLTSGQVAFQVSAIFVLRYFRSERTAVLLAPFLDDPRENLRRRAMETLGVLAQGGVARAAELLAGRDAGGEAAVPESADEIDQDLATPPTGAEESRSRLEQAFTLTDPRQRLEAIEKEVVQLGEAAIEPLQRHLAGEADKLVVGKIFILLGRLRSKAAVPVLLEGLKHADTRCRANAVEALGMIGDPAGLDAVLPFLTDPNNRIRGNAILALRDRPGVEFTIPLLELVQSPEDFFQRTAVYVLAEMARPDHFHLLMILRKSRFPVVRKSVESAIEALKKNGYVFPDAAGSAGADAPAGAAAPASVAAPGLASAPPPAAGPVLSRPKPPMIARAAPSAKGPGGGGAAVSRYEQPPALGKAEAAATDKVPCRWCREPIGRGAQKCHHCGEFQRDEDRPLRSAAGPAGGGDGEPVIDEWGKILGMSAVTLVLLLVPGVNTVLSGVFAVMGLVVCFKMLLSGCGSAFLIIIPFGAQYFVWSNRTSLFANSNLFKVWALVTTLASFLWLVLTALQAAH